MIGAMESIFVHLDHHPLCYQPLSTVNNYSPTLLAKYYVIFGSTSSPPPVPEYFEINLSFTMIGNIVRRYLSLNTLFRYVVLLIHCTFNKIIASIKMKGNFLYVINHVITINKITYLSI